METIQDNCAVFYEKLAKMFFLPNMRKYISPEHKTDFINQMTNAILTTRRYVDEGFFGNITAGDNDDDLRESIAHMCEDMFFIEKNCEEDYDPALSWFVDFAITHLKLPE